MIINEEKKFVAMPWDISDVRQCIEDKNIKFAEGKELTDDECFNVLKCGIENFFDAEQGINWDVIDAWIRQLYRDRIIN